MELPGLNWNLSYFEPSKGWSLICLERGHNKTLAAWLLGFSNLVRAKADVIDSFGH